jgi:hypothetical protein
MEDLAGPAGPSGTGDELEPTAAAGEPAQPRPDDKDWTWTTVRPCPDCGFDPAMLPEAGIGAALRETTPRWAAVLARESVATRPAPTVWSALEYGCHVRDVHRLFAERTSSMLDQDGPRFANWDQDETAVRERYWAQDPAAVADELAESAAAAAAVFDRVPAAGWDRRGYRSNGSEFTVASIGRYHLHDVIHHLHDVAG